MIVKDVWKCVIVRLGEQSVMIFGVMWTLELPVCN